MLAKGLKHVLNLMISETAVLKTYLMIFDDVMVISYFIFLLYLLLECCILHLYVCVCVCVCMSVLLTDLGY